MPKTSATGKEARAAQPLATIRNRGFSLIELMVALAIMVLVASAVPLVLNRSLPTRRVAVTADKLVADIRWLQIQSAALGQPARLAVKESGYLLTLKSADRSREVSLAKSTSLRLLTRADGRIVQELLIYPDGTTSAGQFDVSDSGRHATVQVSLLTGRARRVL